MSSRRILCRRKYDELHAEFSAAIIHVVQQYNYVMEDVDSSMKRILKIAESREPTPHDISMTAARYNISKKHLENFLQIFRKCAERAEKSASNGNPVISSDGVSHLPTNPANQSICISEKTQQSNALSNLDPSEDSELEEVRRRLSEQQLYEVERIISRTRSADGTYVYHVKWLGYETSSDPENFVDERNMMCPDLIKEFEQRERLKKKQRSKKPQEKFKQTRKRKRDPELREKPQACRVLNLCSSTSSSNEEGDNKPISNRAAVTTKHQPCANNDGVTGAYVDGVQITQEYPKKKKLRDMETMRKRIITSSSESEEVEIPNKRMLNYGKHVKQDKKVPFLENFKKVTEKGHPLNGVSEDAHGRSGCGQQSDCKVATDNSVLHSVDGNRRKTSGCSDQKNVMNECTNKDKRNDPYGGFKFVSKESDGFRKGYEAVKVSVVTEHPITGQVVGVVVFIHPLNGNEFAQYIPLREIHENVPLELRNYFLTANSKNQKELALSLLLKKTIKI